MAWIVPLISAAATVYSAYQGSKSKGGSAYGTEGEFKTLPTKTPEQSKNINDILNQLSTTNPQAFNYIRSILSNEPGAFEDFERPYKEQFEQEIVPQIAEQFAGAGALSSSGLNQSLASAGRRLSSDLAAQRANLKQGAINNLLSYQGQGQQSMFQNYFQQGQQGAVQQVLPMVLEYLNKANNMGGFSTTTGGGSGMNTMNQNAANVMAASGSNRI